MNFGQWIVVAFITFAIFIGTLVTVCVRQNVSLVSKDYYQDELVYQEQISRIHNAASLVDKPTITNKRDHLEVTFSKEGKVAGGRIRLFCPSNAEMDRDFDLQPEGNIQRINISSLKSGMYKVRLNWTMDDKEYYVEEIINI